MDEQDELIESVRRDAYGKLSPQVYRRIYDSAFACGGGTFVEIGTSQGAATIVMALGAAKAGRPFRIFTCDQFIVGSRPRGASVAAKAELVREGFRKFGVSDAIELVVGDVADLLGSHDPKRVDFLLIDADGRIDRDLAALYGRLAPDCPIIIDDIDDQAYLHPRGRRLQVDQKHRLTSLLINSFLEAGMFKAEQASGQTGWYRKGDASVSAEAIERLALLCYRQLVFTEVGVRELALKHRLYQALATHLPRLLRLHRRWRRR